MDLKKKTEEMIYENQIMLFKTKTLMMNKKRRQTQVIQFEPTQFKTDLLKIESEDDSLKTDEDSDSEQENKKKNPKKRFSS